MTDLFDEIKWDNFSGAAEVTVKAAEELKRSIDSGSYTLVSELSDHILKIAREIYRAKPAMVSLGNLGAYALAGAEAGADLEDGLKKALDNIDGFVKSMKENTERVVEHASALIEDGSSLITISYSSTVARTLLKAYGGGTNFKVYCLESRPVMEGVSLAKELAEAGIETALINDASAFLFMEEMNMAMVGGDSLSLQGLVNKVGTSGLAMAAEKQGVPFYALCSGEKIIPTRMGYLPKQDRSDPEEILSRLPANLEVINCYFDVTPLDRLTGLVTEKGPIMDEQILEQLNSTPVKHQALQILQI